eukprot:5577551-Amphidinium_carterae.1
MTCLGGMAARPKLKWRASIETTIDCKEGSIEVATRHLRCMTHYVFACVTGTHASVAIECAGRDGHMTIESPGTQWAARLQRLQAGRQGRE